MRPSWRVPEAGLRPPAETQVTLQIQAPDRGHLDSHTVQTKSTPKRNEARQSLIFKTVATVRLSKISETGLFVQPTANPNAVILQAEMQIGRNSRLVGNLDSLGETTVANSPQNPFEEREYSESNV